MIEHGKPDRRLAPLLLIVVLVAGCATDEDGSAGPARTSSPETAAPETSSPETTPPGTTGPGTSPAAVAGLELALHEVAEGFEAPLQVLPAPTGGLLVVEQQGTVRRWEGGKVTTFLDLRDRVTAGGERGLLGVILHPRHPGDDRLFVHYSGEDGRTVLSSLPLVDGVPDASAERRLLTREQPAPNHNGGQLTFGPDGLLYLGLGDGGGAGDQFGNGQRPDTLLGTILRLDVDADDADGGDHRPADGRGAIGGYAVPADNPFADGGGGAPEVWAYGLRNPWRFAFGAGRLYIADVGQNAVEEINAVPDDAAGMNYGWPILEGPACFAGPDCDPAGTELPISSYRHEDTGGCGVIGGPVYAGSRLPALRDWFLYSDLCAGFLRVVRVGDDGRVHEAELLPGGQLGGRVLGFGVDQAGEVHLALQDGRILRLDPAEPS